MVDAFDNLPESEVVDMGRRIFLGKTENHQRTQNALFNLSQQAEDIRSLAIERSNSGYAYDDLEEAIRVVRSQIRMYGKDADFYTSTGDFEPPIPFAWPWEKSNNKNR